jgi:spiro-SPASM protein
VLLRPALVDRLASARTHPGRLLCYLPESPMRDPISGDGCVPIAAPIARTTRSFRLDSDRQIQRLTQASVHLNGELVGSDAEDLIHRLHWTSEIDPLPREIVLELNTTRATSPVFWPGRFTKIDRANLSPELAERIFEQLGSCDDVRLTLGGVGDPLLHPQVFEIIGLARSHGIRAIHVETDLLPEDPSLIENLVESEIDVVSVHLPAMTHATYASLMGADRFTQVIDNIRRFVTCRQQRGIGLPLLAPLFTKCQANLVEMEAWYDQWLKAVGSVVVVEPTSYGGMVPDCGVADMSAPKRRACNRINSRMTLLSNGMAVSCEQDVLAKQLVGDVLSHTIQEIWQEGFAGLRQSHGCGQWAPRPLCAGCREWHRT